MRGLRRRGTAAATVLVVVAAIGSVPGSVTAASVPGRSARPTALSGDFNGDGRPDIALVGASGWNGVATALRNSSGGFTVSYAPAPAFAAWASLPGVKMFTGKFDDDQDDDIALTGVAGWTTLKLARSNGDGTFTVAEAAAGSFPAWAGVPNARVLPGDFNGDGRTDLALTGGRRATIPVAFANADGTFTVTANPAPVVAGNAQYSASRLFAEDFDADGRTDLAVVPGGEALITDDSVTVAHSTGFGSFSESSTSLSYFIDATDNGQAVTAGDFNNDNRADLAVVLQDMILVAYSTLTGFDLYRAGATAQFQFRATRPGARIVGTDNDCDGRTDLVVISESTGGWMTMPVAMPRRDEEFFVMDDPLPNFPQWSRAAGAQLLTGDYDGDGCEDLALTGGAGWNLLPVAMSSGDGSYIERNVALPDFAAWAAGASPVTLPPPPVETLGTLSLLDTEVTSGVASSMAIGADGLPIISYFVGSGLENLRVAHCQDAACTAVTTTDIDTAGDVGWWSSIKIGSDGLPLISYVHARNLNPATFTYDLKVAHCQDVGCTSATITTLDSAARVDDPTSLAIGGDGLGLIAYQDTASSTSTRMKVAHCLNIACSAASLTTVDTVQPDNGERGGYSQIGIATGNHGLGLVSYYEGGTNQMLKVAACTNAACSTAVKSIVDQKLGGANTLHGGWTSVTFGIDGLALISYNANYSLSGSDLKVAHCLNVYCTESSTITADTGGYVGWRTSTAISGDGLGVVSYYDITNRDLKMAHCANLACSSATTTTVDAFDDVGARSSVAMGTDGLPLISYQGPGPLGTILRVVHCGNADCTAVIVAPF